MRVRSAQCILDTLCRAVVSRRSVLIRCSYMRRIKRLLIVHCVVLLALSFSSRAYSQTLRDSVSVFAAAWDSVMGAPPFAHPGGSTTSVCLESSSLVASFDSVPVARLSFVNAVAQEIQRHGVTVLSSCKMRPESWYGGWIVGPEDQPAVIVRFSAPVFTHLNVAEIHFADARGGRWGRGMVCTIERRAVAGWKIRRCQVTFIALERKSRQAVFVRAA